ncbi:MAG: hypothetical protein KF812_11115 [Fimbriimonadaceae bacterium]|nr:hypothetical protein [Fimbriimonadaceae bacterium]
MLTTMIVVTAVAVATTQQSSADRPATLPAWMRSQTARHIDYRRGSDNWAILGLEPFARDMFATGVGHAMAYEALATGHSASLETEVFDRINTVLKNPPLQPVDEYAVSPTFSRRYFALEQVFEWSHTLHFQTIDVLMHPGWSDQRKDEEIEKLWKIYSAQPYALSGLPMNMEYLDGFEFSGEFRTRYPKVNALFWGYHWLQTVNYDMFYRVPRNTFASQYEVIGDRYHTTELYNTRREFMPMTAETSPRFAKRFPEIANSFDNLHMLHDNVNDILAAPGLSQGEKQREIELAIWRVLATTHIGETAGEGQPVSLHDHRYSMGMPGMGMMKGSDEEVMYMPGMGWMNMSECGHCSMSLSQNANAGATVTADGWTMAVRCALCARDMAAQTLGRAIIRSATENPDQMLVLISDELGNWTSNIPTVVFLEYMDEHPSCNRWSKAFSSLDAFHAYLRERPEYAGAEPLTLEEWASRNGGEPETYKRIDRPSPYQRSREGQP